eukprot:SAG31_NODE_35980_length_317_cov_1.665138_1_plen_22_part_01
MLDLTGPVAVHLMLLSLCILAV